MQEVRDNTGYELRITLDILHIGVGIRLELYRPREDE